MIGPLVPKLSFCRSVVVFLFLRLDSPDGTRPIAACLFYRLPVRVVSQPIARIDVRFRSSHLPAHFRARRSASSLVERVCVCVCVGERPNCSSPMKYRKNCSARPRCITSNIRLDKSCPGRRRAAASSTAPMYFIYRSRTV